MTKSKGDPMEQAMQDALESVERIEQESNTDDKAELGIEVENKMDVVDVSDTALENAEDVAVAGEAPEQSETPDAQDQQVKEQLLRMAADFDNFRKRTRREQDDLRRYGVERMASELLPVIDNLERALSHADGDSDPVIQGVQMVFKQFIDVLSNYGIKSFSSVGAVFDPEVHEALSQVSDSGKPVGSIVEELHAGYMIHDRLLRPAKVVVASAPPPAAETKE